MGRFDDNTQITWNIVTTVFRDVRNLSLTCTKLHDALSELTNSEATVTFPGPMEVFVMQHPIIIWFDKIFVLCHIAIFETCWTLNISLHRYLFKGLYWVWKFNLEIFFLNSHLTTSQKSKIHRSAPFPLNNGQDIHFKWFSILQDRNLEQTARVQGGKDQGWGWRRWTSKFCQFVWVFYAKNIKSSNTSKILYQEETSQVAHFLLSHQLLSSLLTAHHRNGTQTFIFKRAI